MAARVFQRATKARWTSFFLREIVVFGCARPTARRARFGVDEWTDFILKNHFPSHGTTRVAISYSRRALDFWVGD